MNTGNGSQQANFSTSESNVILHLEIFKDGSMGLQAPIPPKEVIKLLQNVCVELMFGAFKPKDDSGIVIPRILPDYENN